MRRERAPWDGFGPASGAERQQADLFLAALLGRPRARRRPFVATESSLAEQDASVSLTMRGGGVVGNTPDATNVREDLIHALDRLHALWSITNENYDLEYARVTAMAPRTRATNAASSLRRTMAALRQNQDPSLHWRVMRNFLEIDVCESVGGTQPNRTSDVRRLQTVLVALGMLDARFITEGTDTHGTVAGAGMPETLGAIRRVKAALAGGRLGWDAIHADELESGGDRFGGRTYELDDNSIFVPRGVSSGASDVHVFFSPGGATGNSGLNAVLHHGLRGACDGSGFILIGVPGRDPGFVSIDTARIETLLRRVGRSTTIGRLRLSAHSRGGRGLRETLNRRLVDLTKIDRVAILDCGWSSVSDALTRARIPASRVFAYQVIDDALPASVARTVRIPKDCARSIGYSRLIRDAMVTRPTLTIPSGVSGQLLTLPARGGFRAVTAAPGGAFDLPAWCTTNAAAIRTIVGGESTAPNGLAAFVEANDLGRLGMRFTTNIYAHHFFVCEIAHEITG